ncbi:MAG: hypothetical protein ABSC95_18790 [Acetobacteraceae bacterium]
MTRRYGPTVAVDAVSLRTPHASYCCLLGPSGCRRSFPPVSSSVARWPAR